MKNSHKKAQEKRLAEIKEAATAAATLAADASLLLGSGITLGDAAEELGVRPSEIVSALEQAAAVLDEAAKREWAAIEAAGAGENARELFRIVRERCELLGSPAIRALGLGQ